MANLVKNQTDFARQNRREQTPAEERVWQYLRARRFMGLKFKRQVPVGAYVIDFLCVQPAIAIELDGGQHGDPEGMVYDAKRTAYLEASGFLVLRYWNPDVLNNFGGLLEDLRQAVVRPDSY